MAAVSMRDAQHAIAMDFISNSRSTLM